jgi:hypothetical protein
MGNRMNVKALLFAVVGAVVALFYALGGSPSSGAAPGRLTQCV